MWYVGKEGGACLSQPDVMLSGEREILGEKLTVLAFGQTIHHRGPPTGREREYRLSWLRGRICGLCSIRALNRMHART